MAEAAMELASLARERVTPQDLERIHDALEGAAELARRSGTTPARVEFKSGRPNNPVTDLDLRIDRFLREHLPRGDEGWLSEESRDDPARCSRRRVWIVDPLDGTREFLEGVPEWSISIGLVEDGKAVAGGIANPSTGEVFLGAAGMGVTLNGTMARARPQPRPGQALVLASRSEWKRGEWSRWTDGRIQVQPVGSIAYKLARVAAGLADATWTFVPKHEWDVAAGVALVAAAGGAVRTLEGHAPAFNRSVPLLSGLMAFSASSREILEPFVRGSHHDAQPPNGIRPSALEKSTTRTDTHQRWR